MNTDKTALILIGYQNDYFAPDGILHTVIEESAKVTGVLANTMELIERLCNTSVLMVSTPILFTPDYRELTEATGILKTIKEVGAFKAGTSGGETIPELRQFGERIIEIPGKRGPNAFSNTDLGIVLKEHGISDIVLAGVATSICIDSTGRSAFERGYKVTVLSDCTSGRTAVEQEFFCNEIFPIYAEVMEHSQLLTRLVAKE